MNKVLLCALLVFSLSLAACKDKKKPAEEAVLKTDFTAVTQKALANKQDWTKDILLYVDPMLTCANASPVQVKYVFKADAFEQPTVTLILFKGEDDKIYACGFKGDNPKPEYQVIKAEIPAKAPRFYPGALPKPDSCLNNARILDNSGRTAGWLSKITC